MKTTTHLNQIFNQVIAYIDTESASSVIQGEIDKTNTLSIPMPDKDCEEPERWIAYIQASNLDMTSGWSIWSGVKETPYFKCLMIEHDRPNEVAAGIASLMIPSLRDELTLEYRHMIEHSFANELDWRKTQAEEDRKMLLVIDSLLTKEKEPKAKIPLKTKTVPNRRDPHQVQNNKMKQYTKNLRR